VGGPLLTPKPIWRYLGFFFDRKLSFWHYCHYYATKNLSTIKAIKLLGNSSRGLSPLHKRLLYHTCVLPIVLYGFQLWHYKNAPMKFHIYELTKLQHQVALWITSAFKTSPSEGMEGIAGLIPIPLQLCKLSGCSHLRYSAILPNHAISSLLEHGHTQPTSLYKLALPNLTPTQKAKLKSLVTDIDHHLIQIYPAFTTKPVHILTPGHRLVDSFPS